MKPNSTSHPDSHRQHPGPAPFQPEQPKTRLGLLLDLAEHHVRALLRKPGRFMPKLFADSPDGRFVFDDFLVRDNSELGEFALRARLITAVRAAIIAVVAMPIRLGSRPKPGWPPSSEDGMPRVGPSVANALAYAVLGHLSRSGR